MKKIIKKIEENKPFFHLIIAVLYMSLFFFCSPVFLNMNKLDRICFSILAIVIFVFWFLFFYFLQIKKDSDIYEKNEGCLDNKRLIERIKILSSEAKMYLKGLIILMVLILLINGLITQGLGLKLDPIFLNHEEDISLATLVLIIVFFGGLLYNFLHYSDLKNILIEKMLMDKES